MLLNYTHLFYLIYWTIHIIDLQILSLEASIPHNGQTHSNNSLAICRRIVWVCWPFLWGWRLKGYACIPTRKNRWIQNFTESFVGNNGQSPWPYTFFVYRSVTVHTCNIFFPYQFDFGESLQKVKIENAI